MRYLPPNTQAAKNITDTSPQSRNAMQKISSRVLTSPFPPVLRSQDTKAGCCSGQKHILDKLNLCCQRHCRHIILIHAAKHKSISNGDQCKHQILQYNTGTSTPIVCDKTHHCLFFYSLFLLHSTTILSRNL